MPAPKAVPQGPSMSPRASLLACTLATAFVAGHASATVILTEGPAASERDPSGNFSDSIAAPTDAGTLGLGTSTIEGILYSGRMISGGGFRFDDDVLSFTVPAGLELQSLTYTGSVQIPSLGDPFFLEEIDIRLLGPNSLDTHSLVSTGNDVMPLLSLPGPTLGTGTYIIVLEDPVGYNQSSSNPLLYTIDLVTVPVPEPGSLALLAIGGLIFARRRRA